MEKKTRILGISGHMGSGKDTFAEILAKISSTPVERHAYADKLKEVVELITGVKMEKVENSCFYNTVYNYTQEQKNIFLPVWGKTIGTCLQIIGTECMRNNFDPDVWVKSVFETAGKKCIESNHILILSDVRFPNEADYLLSQGGIIVRMEGDPMNIRANSTRDLTHISETALDNYDKFTEIIHSPVPDLPGLEEKIVKIIQKYNIC